MSSSDSPIRSHPYTISRAQLSLLETAYVIMANLNAFFQRFRISLIYILVVVIVAMVMLFTILSGGNVEDETALDGTTTEESTIEESTIEESTIEETATDTEETPSPNLSPAQAAIANVLVFTSPILFILIPVGGLWVAISRLIEDDTRVDAILLTDQHFIIQHNQAEVGYALPQIKLINALPGYWRVQTADNTLYIPKSAFEASAQQQVRQWFADVKGSQHD